LGDFLDTAALRSGALGTKDETAEIAPDMTSGLQFLEALRPDVILCGNHEDRIWNLAEHYNAVKSYLAKQCISSIESKARKLGAKLIPYTYKQAWQVADIAFLHGTIYGENAVRDTAEVYAPCNGKVVFAHSHRAGVARGRRGDNPLGLNTGTLMDIASAGYAKLRKSTLSWTQGFVWGVYDERKGRSHLWLHDNGQANEWHLPV
jgi:hypothetical protein